jgi:hypothetical protein
MSPIAAERTAPLPPPPTTSRHLSPFQFRKQTQASRPRIHRRDPSNTPIKGRAPEHPSLHQVWLWNIIATSQIDLERYNAALVNGAPMSTPPTPPAGYTDSGSAVHQ